MKSKKLLWFIMMVLVLSTVLAACGNKDNTGNNAGATEGSSNVTTNDTNADTGSEKPKEVKLTLRHILVKDTDQKQLVQLNDVINGMKNEIPGLSIELEGVKDDVNRDQKLPADFAAGSPPSIFDLFGGTDTQKYAKTGLLLDLTPILDELGIKDKFANLSEFTVDGKIYGLPRAGFAEAFFYNKKLFQENNVQVPTTWEEFLQVCETFKAKGITPIAFASKDAWAANMMLNTAFYRTAGPDIAKKLANGTKKWTDPDMKQGFELYKTILDKGYTTKDSLALGYSEQQNQFKAGDAAMMFDGSWANSAVTDPEKSTIPNDVGFFSFPNVGGPGDGYVNASFSDGYGFSAKLDADQMNAIKLFIKDFYNSEQQKRQLVENGFIPAMTLDDYSGVNPVIGEILDAVHKATSTFPAFDSITPPKTKGELEKNIQALIGGAASIDDVLQAVQKVQDTEITQ